MVSNAEVYRVFICGLGYGVHQYKLEFAFQTFGEIVDCDFEYNRHYAFISYTNQKDAILAIARGKDLNIEGYEPIVEWAIGWPKNRTRRKTFSKISDATFPNNCTVYCSNLRGKTTQNVLENVFSEFGTIEEIITKGNRSDYALIRFSRKWDATMAIFTIDGTLVNGWPVNCTWSDKPCPKFVAQEGQGTDSAIGGSQVPFQLSTKAKATTGRLNLKSSHVWPILPKSIAMEGNLQNPPAAHPPAFNSSSDSSLTSRTPAAASSTTSRTPAAASSTTSRTPAAASSSTSRTAAASSTTSRTAAASSTTSRTAAASSTTSRTAAASSTTSRTAAASSTTSRTAAASSTTSRTPAAASSSTSRTPAAASSATSKTSAESNTGVRKLGAPETLSNFSFDLSSLRTFVELLRELKTAFIGPDNATTSTPSFTSATYRSDFAAATNISSASASSNEEYTNNDFDTVFDRTGPNNCVVYCKGLSKNTTIKSLKEVFSPFGIVEEINPHVDRSDYALIRFNTKEAATLAICSINNSKINGCTVKCTWSNRPADRNRQVQIATVGYLEVSEPVTATSTQPHPPPLSLPSVSSTASSLSAAASAISPKQDKSSESEKVKKRNTDTFCKICMDEELGVVFLPCGHLTSCSKCAEKINFCPLCRKLITSKVRTYLS